MSLLLKNPFPILERELGGGTLFCVCRFGPCRCNDHYYPTKVITLPQLVLFVRLEICFSSIQLDIPSERAAPGPVVLTTLSVLVCPWNVPLQQCAWTIPPIRPRRGTDGSIDLGALDDDMCTGYVASVTPIHLVAEPCCVGGTTRARNGSSCRRRRHEIVSDSASLHALLRRGIVHSAWAWPITGNSPEPNDFVCWERYGPWCQVQGIPRTGSNPSRHTAIGQNALLVGVVLHPMLLGVFGAGRKHGIIHSFFLFCFRGMFLLDTGCRPWTHPHKHGTTLPSHPKTRYNVATTPQIWFPERRTTVSRPHHQSGRRSGQLTFEERRHAKKSTTTDWQGPIVGLYSTKIIYDSRVVRT